MVGKGKNQTVAYTFTEEIINVHEALRFAETPEAVALKLGSRTFRQVIHTFVQRARKVDKNGRALIWSA
eukprot:12816314-Alexandrium_andersonii.AAC.1